MPCVKPISFACAGSDRVMRRIRKRLFSKKWSKLRRRRMDCAHRILDDNRLPALWSGNDTAHSLRTVKSRLSGRKFRVWRSSCAICAGKRRSLNTTHSREALTDAIKTGMIPVCVGAEDPYRVLKQIFGTVRPAIVTDSGAFQIFILSALSKSWTVRPQPLEGAISAD